MTEVPYISQLSNAPRNDCGPACVLMLARWIRPGDQTTVAQIAARIDPDDNGTVSRDLANALAWLRLTPTLSSVARHPFIQLVDYLKLPVGNRYDNVARLHWIVRLSDTTYHDPYHVGRRGAFLSAPKAALDGAERGVWNRVGIVEKPNMSRDEGKAREAYDRVFHVIPADTPEDRAVEIFRAAWRAGKQTVGGSYDDAGLGTGLRSKKAILHGIPESRRQAYRDFYSAWYPTTVVEFAGAPLPPPPPPPSAASALIGVNALNDADAARAAYDAGCRFFLIMDHYPVARELADRGATVLFRKYIADWKLDGDQMAAQVLEAAGGNPHPAIVHTLFNEGDSWGTGTPAEIAHRARIEKRATELLLARGTCVALGSFAVGNPDITRTDICDAMREYAAIYNSSPRVYFDLHTYSPRLRFEMDHWYETRWQWFFTSCGFDPTARRIVSGETGVDQGGVGGFPAHGATAQQVIDWCRAYRAASIAPMLIAGKRYPSPFVGGAIFQCGNHPGWQGYDVRGYLAAMREAKVWQ